MGSGDHRPADPNNVTGEGDRGSAVHPSSSDREQPTWQKLVKQAFARQAEDLRGVSGDEFYKRLDPLQRKAVLLWDFDYQVCEGGIPHWIMNAREAWITEVTEIVKEIDTETGKEVLSILEQVLPLAGSESEEDMCLLGDLSNRYLFANPIGSETAGTRFINESLRDRFVNDVETWLQTQLRVQP
jgi:hypothetical protein